MLGSEINDIGKNLRQSPRRKALLHAFACDLGDKTEIRCMVRDVSASGCRVVSSLVGEFPKHILLTPEGFTTSFICEVVWREGACAGLRFETTTVADTIARLKAHRSHTGQLKRGGHEPVLLTYADRLLRHPPGITRPA